MQSPGSCELGSFHYVCVCMYLCLPLWLQKARGCNAAQQLLSWHVLYCLLTVIFLLDFIKTPSVVSSNARENRPIFMVEIPLDSELVYCRYTFIFSTKPLNFTAHNYARNITDMDSRIFQFYQDILVLLR